MIADNHSFVYGVATGVVFMFFVGWFAKQLRKQRFVAQKPGRKVTVEGGASAGEIVNKGIAARACVTFLGFVILLCFAALAVFLYWVWQY